MRAAISTVCTTVLLIGLVTPAAFAQATSGNDGGEGWWGETSDKIVTNFGFSLIAFFPLFIFLMSILQWRLEKRKERRKAAAKARTARADLRGGW